MAKLTPQKKQEIIARIRKGESAAKVANDYNISGGYASQIEAAASAEENQKNGSTWSENNDEKELKQVVYDDLVEELKRNLDEVKIRFADEALKRRGDGGQR